MRKYAVTLIAVIIAFGCGFATGRMKSHAQLTFHDMIVGNPVELSRLITPDDKRIKALAAELKTPENVYKYVQEHIANAAADPAVPAGEILTAGRASCLGKAILLCALYRATGIPANDVRVVAGEVDIPGSIIDHAWLEMEYKGRCIQQDSSNVLGTFSFDQFKDTTYTNVFIRDEEYVFNDKQFALVSHLNKLKGMGGHPPIQ
jgi:hypothetical protein